MTMKFGNIDEKVKKLTNHEYIIIYLTNQISSEQQAKHLLSIHTIAIVDDVRVNEGKR